MHKAGIPVNLPHPNLQTLVVGHSFLWWDTQCKVAELRPFTMKRTAVPLIGVPGLGSAGQTQKRFAPSDTKSFCCAGPGKQSSTGNIRSTQECREEVPGAMNCGNSAARGPAKRQAPVNLSHQHLSAALVFVQSAVSLHEITSDLGMKSHRK